MPEHFFLMPIKLDISIKQLLKFFSFFLNERVMLNGHLHSNNLSLEFQH